MPAGSTNRPLFSLILLAALSLVPALASQPSKLIASVDGDYSQHRLSSDGRTLVYTVREGAAEVLWSVATDGTHPPQRLTPENVKEAARIRSFLISPNGKNVVFVSVSIRPPVAGEEALGHSFSGPSVVSGVGGEIYGEGLTFTSPVPSETTGQEHSEYLYSVPLDGSSAPVLLAEGKIKRTIIPAIPATASQPPGSDREYTTYPFSFQYIFSDDSQYLLYVQSEGVRTEVQISRGGFSGQVDFPVHRVFRVNLEHPQQRVDITPTLHPTIRSAVIYQIGFVPRGHDAYIMYKRNDPMLSLPLDSYNEQEIQIIYLNQPETPVLGFSAVHYYQQFVPDGKRLLLVEPDVLKAPQLYVYDLTTGLKTHLSTASTHTDGRLFLHSVELYGDWVLYYPKGRAYAVFNPNLANVPCFVTHLHYPQRDRKISDNCNQASLDLTKNRIYYSTFERMAGESTYGFSGPYYLMRQFLNEPGSVERLAEGHWESGFENANIFGASLTPDNHWITQSDRSTPDNTTPKTQWRNPDNSTDTVDWHHSGYFTTDGMRLVLPEQVTEPGPSVLAGRYDPLILPTFETTAGQYITQTPMPDNCRIFTYTRQKDSRYYMTDCDRPVVGSSICRTGYSCTADGRSNIFELVYLR